MDAQFTDVDARQEDKKAVHNEVRRICRLAALCPAKDSSQRATTIKVRTAQGLDGGAL